MTTLELVLIIILYIVIGLLSIKPILKVVTNGIITKRDRVLALILIVLYPIFWIVVTLISVVLVVKEFYSED
jgi:hypothetical protein